MSGPLVSCVIPAHNAERFISAAVESVLNQTYPHIECIVVDDGSTDGTSRILGDFGPHIRRFAQENRGVSAARNEGIRASEGDWVAFLDADDVWLPDKLTKQIAVLQRRPEVALVYTGCLVVDEHLLPIEHLGVPSEHQALRNSLLMQLPVMSVAQTGLVRRAVLHEVGGFDEAMSTSADTDLACRIALGHPVAPVDEPLVLYRQHPGQMHHDLGALEADMSRLFEKIFDGSDEAPLRDLRPIAYARLHYTIAVARWSRNDRRAALGHLAKAARQSVSTTSQDLVRYAWRRLFSSGRRPHE